jgi:hypothetical protein
MKDEVKNNLEQSGHDLFKILSWHLPARTEKNHEKFS